MNEELKANVEAIIFLVAELKKVQLPDERYSRIRQIEMMLREDILPAVTEQVATAGVDVDSKEAA